MPTTNNEAENILKISKEYILPEEMKKLFIKLDEEVGKTTDNDSLKKSLSMMREMVDIKPIPPKWYLKYFLYSVIIIHFGLVAAVAMSFLILPFKTNWYIALPIMTFIWFFSTNRVDCKITNLENNLRQKLGMPRIGAFVGHYFLKPIKRMLKLK